MEIVLIKQTGVLKKYIVVKKMALLSRDIILNLIHKFGTNVHFKRR